MKKGYVFLKEISIAILLISLFALVVLAIKILFERLLVVR